jgi:hypothetical protein
MITTDGLWPLIRKGRKKHAQITKIIIIRILIVKKAIDKLLH